MWGGIIIKSSKIIVNVSIKLKLIVGSECIESNLEKATNYTVEWRLSKDLTKRRPEMALSLDFCRRPRLQTSPRTSSIQEISRNKKKLTEFRLRSLHRVRRRRCGEIYLLRREEERRYVGSIVKSRGSTALRRAVTSQLESGFRVVSLSRATPIADNFSYQWS